MKNQKKILVTGGAGYVGSVLCPKLLKHGYKVRVIDLMIYDPHSLDQCKKNSNFQLIKGDIRDKKTIEKAVEGIDCIIHLAAISNDPTSDLDKNLTKSVNYEAVKLLLKTAKKYKVKRFINASSSSVFGVKKEKNITEDLICNPLTAYSKYKLKVEKLVNKSGSKGFIVVNIRPATICGYSPRQRLDLTVNILTSSAITKGLIVVQGGKQRRPNVTIEDITNLYMRLIEEKAELIAGETFNVGFENMKIMNIALLVKRTLERKTRKKIKIIIEKTFDQRDYHISSEKIKARLGWRPQYRIKDMIIGLADAFQKGLIINSDDAKYYNIRKMNINHFK